MSLETSLDSIRRGELVLEQPRSGYRFSVDAVLLADFAEQLLAAAHPDCLVDLGSGVGVVGLLLARRWTRVRVVLVEIQPELAALAAANVRRNQLQERVEARCVDLREVSRWCDARPELVVSNPPFFKIGSGRSSPSAQVSLARHEHTCSLEELLAAAAAGLAPGGRLALIHAAEREAELLEALAHRELILEARRRVVPLPGRAPTRVLLLARRAGKAAGVRELPPLVIEDRPGQLSVEARRILGDP